MAETDQQTPTVSQNETQESTPIAEIDVAIVGGGIAGLTAAYTLLSDKRQCRVLVFEAQGRLGGRLLSINVPGVNFPAELGAMRYNFTRHSRLRGLIEKLDLAKSAIAFDIGDNTGYYLRGRRFRASEVNARKCPACRGEANFCQACGALLPQPYAVRSLRRASMHDLDLVLPEGFAETSPQTPDDLIRYAIIAALCDLEFSDRTTAMKSTIKEEIRALIEGSEIKHANWRQIVAHGKLRYDANEPAISLTSTGFWNILQHYLGNEGFLLAHDGSGYESIVSSWNAAEAMEWFAADIGGRNTPWRMLRKGYGSLCNELETQIRQSTNWTDNPIRVGHSLSRVEKQSTGLWRMYFETQSHEERGGVGKPSTFIVDAQHVILALPAEALKSIVVNHPTMWDHQFRQSTLRSVRQHKMFKVFLVFREAWWTDHTHFDDVIGSDSGRIFTDLPIRQVYYYSPRWIKKHMGNSKSKSLPIIMASYSDSHYVGFWRPFLGNLITDEDSEKMLRGYETYLETYLASQGLTLSEVERNRLQQLRPFLAPQRMQDKIVDQLTELHGVEPGAIEAPILGIYKDWGRETYNVGGWHTWEVNYSPTDIIEQMLQPQPGERLYICGEAYSTQQGWVEGAVDSAEKVVNKILESLPPSR